MLLALLLATPGCAASPTSRQREAASAVPATVIPVTATQPLSQPPLAGPSEPAPIASGPGRRYPSLPTTPADQAALLASIEAALRDPATTAEALPDLGHQQQLLIRQLAKQPQQARRVRQALPARWQRLFDLQLEARRAFLAMHPPRGGVARVPPWRIRPPAPASELLRFYQEASRATGIPWEVLAAINLVESGMGRIDGVSVAGAQGPMQFLPSTWAEPGIGQGGDIRDPRSAIHAAARYLVRRGGRRDIRQALWGYNNSDHYGRGVLAYAALLRLDPEAYRGLYHWEVHLNSSAGDLWLPVGLELQRPEPVEAFLRRHPGSAPPPSRPATTAATAARPPS